MVFLGMRDNFSIKNMERTGVKLQMGQSYVKFEAIYT